VLRIVNILAYNIDDDSCVVDALSATIAAPIHIDDVSNACRADVISRNGGPLMLQELQIAERYAPRC
jgi:hypothetical protein